jgi:hypothetical protein
MQNVDLVTFWGFPKDFLQRKQVSVKKMDNFYIQSHTVVEEMSVFIFTGINRHCSLSNTATMFAAVCYTILNIFQTCFIIRGFLRFLLQLKSFYYGTDN